MPAEQMGVMFTIPQSRLLRRIERCPETGYALRTKSEIRMAKVLEREGVIEIRDTIAHRKGEE